MPEYEIRWQDGPGPPGRNPRYSFTTQEDYAGAVWEATRLLRARIQRNRAAVNAGLYGTGFVVQLAAPEAGS